MKLSSGDSHYTTTPILENVLQHKNVLRQFQINMMIRDLQRLIQNPVKHLRWCFFGKIVNIFQLLTIFRERPILDV